MNHSVQLNSAREHTRTGMTADSLQRAFLDNLFFIQGRYLDVATPLDQYMALAYTVRDRMLERWVRTAKTYKQAQARTVSYLSAEFLLGPHLANNLTSLGIYQTTHQVMDSLGLDFHEIIDQEVDPGLGNGGLGRLAACFLDSLATLEIPAIGYGIRYEYGIFEQHIDNGWQKEISDNWLRDGNPWELPRPKLKFPVFFGGTTEHYRDASGNWRVRWNPAQVINGVAYDTPILGCGVNNANLLRLWRSVACESFDFDTFNRGDYYGAVRSKVEAENISKVLYPNDEAAGGRELRLKQQFFFVTCSLQDMLRLYLQQSNDLKAFHEKFAVQLNDTHPAIAVPELMRLLLDEHGMGWDDAWEVTTHTFAYTNHTLLPEALETWPVDLLSRILPRHMEIIYEINHRFMDEMRIHFPWDNERIARLSIIDDSRDRGVRMANLATLGSYSVNGVAELHSELVKQVLLPDFHAVWPERFHNVTNGVTPRRFLQMSNPGLNHLMDELAGDGWARNLSNLSRLETHAGDAAFQERWREMKRAAKERLARRIKMRTGESVDPASMFDVQTKRIHEYKRPHLNLLHVIALYNRIKQNPNGEHVPRTFIFAGKAAPGYAMAKLIIKAINSVADMVNRDPQTRDLLRVIFYPDFNIKSAQPIYPAADLSEQISTAGTEASGTGNMKFALNGALTIGTLDGANIEIRKEVGKDNFFLFGLDLHQVERLRQEGYRPRDQLHDNPELQEAFSLIEGGFFSHGDPELFRPLTRNLLERDPFLVLADYRSYAERQNDVALAFADTPHWSRMSILNTARMGKFSSDRAIGEYCEHIWRVAPVSVTLSE